MMRILGQVGLKLDIDLCVDEITFSLSSWRRVWVCFVGEYSDFILEFDLLDSLLVGDLLMCIFN